MGGKDGGGDRGNGVKDYSREQAGENGSKRFCRGKGQRVWIKGE